MCWCTRTGWSPAPLTERSRFGAQTSKVRGWSGVACVCVHRQRARCICITVGAVAAAGSALCEPPHLCSRRQHPHSRPGCQPTLVSSLVCAAVLRCTAAAPCRSPLPAHGAAPHRLRHLPCSQPGGRQACVSRAAWGGHFIRHAGACVSRCVCVWVCGVARAKAAGKLWRSSSDKNTPRVSRPLVARERRRCRRTC